MQASQIKAPVETVLAAAIDVLQDRGWSIVKTDRDMGLLQAETTSRLEPLGPAEESLRDFKVRQQRIETRQSPDDQWTRWERITLHVEPWGAQTRVRMVVTRCGSLPPMSYDKRIDNRGFSRGRWVRVNVPTQEESYEVLFPEVYEDWMARIARAVQIRQQLPE